jgi:hypothetical protein
MASIFGIYIIVEPAENEWMLSDSRQGLFGTKVFAYHSI